MRNAGSARRGCVTAAFTRRQTAGTGLLAPSVRRSARSRSPKRRRARRRGRRRCGRRAGSGHSRDTDDQGVRAAVPSAPPGRREHQGHLCGHAAAARDPVPRRLPTRRPGGRPCFCIPDGDLSVRCRRPSRAPQEDRLRTEKRRPHRLRNVVGQASCRTPDRRVRARSELAGLARRTAQITRSRARRAGTHSGGDGAGTARRMQIRVGLVLRLVLWCNSLCRAGSVQRLRGCGLGTPGRAAAP
jgi:hypothetical protein